MAWTKRYMIPFQSRLEKQYAVYILDSEDVYSEVKVLTGSAEPFTTQEDAKNDIFTPIRKQTGYLRIIDEEGGNILEEIMPRNNTEKMVLLVERENVNGEYQDGAIAWKGFLCAEAFTQPWNNNTKEIEFPIKSVLAALEDVQVNTAFSGSILRLARTIAEGIIALCADMPFESVTHIGSIVMSEWMMKKINHKIFFHDETFQSGGDVITTQQGDSYYKAISEIMKTIGLTARQNGNRLYFARYDGGGYDLYINTMSWAEFYNIATEKTSTITQGKNIQKTDLLNTISFRSNRNEVTFNPGGRVAKVVLNITTMPGTISGLQLPETTEDESPVDKVIVQPVSEMETLNYDINYLIQGQQKYNIQFGVYVQSHEPRSGYEVFAFNKYSHSYDSGQNIWAYTRTENGSLSGCMSNTPMRWRGFNDIGEPSSVPNYNLSTGAFPVRWYHKEKDSLNPINLASGLFLMQQVLRGGDTPGWDNSECYSISTPTQPTIQGGAFFVINFDCHCFFGFYLKEGIIPSIWGSRWIDTPSFDQFRIENKYWGMSEPVDIMEDVPFKMACALNIGNYWWNGSAWVTGGAWFYIDFKGKNIVSNKNAVNADIEDTEGWFVPVPNDMTGTVTFKILSFCHTDYEYVFELNPLNHNQDETYTVRPYAKIVEALTVGVAYTKTITESERSTNTYRRVIMESGFSEDKEINLTIGTDNNNHDSTPSFLMNNAGTENIATLAYYSEGRTVNERPEEHLLGRVANYYNQVRRAFRSVIESGADIFNVKYNYNGRWFFGIDKRHEWRDDEQEVKFIEVL